MMVIKLVLAFGIVWVSTRGDRRPASISVVR
jgi:hypothetical protein